MTFEALLVTLVVNVVGEL